MEKILFFCYERKNENRIFSRFSSSDIYILERETTGVVVHIFKSIEEKEFLFLLLINPSVRSLRDVSF